MTKRKKIATVTTAITTAITLVLAISVFVISAAANNAIEPDLPAMVEEPVIEPQTVSNDGIPGMFAEIRNALSPEQIEWVMQVMDTGELPDLTVEQLEELKTALIGYVSQGFPGVNSEFFMQQFDLALAAMQDHGAALGDELTAILMSSAGELLAQGFAEGVIPQDIYDIVIAAMEICH